MLPAGFPSAGEHGHGVLTHISGSGCFGFVKPDGGFAGSTDIFALPPRAGFPKIGTRVEYDVVVDSKNSKLRADNLSLEGMPAQGAPARADVSGAQFAYNVGDTGSGMMKHISSNGAFGFIKPDDGASDIFALPSRTGFPPVGTHLTFTFATDPKNGKMRAENLEVQGASIVQYQAADFGTQDFSATAMSGMTLPYQATGPNAGDRGSGVLAHVADGGGFGFVKPDNGSSDVFALPPPGGWPAAGSRVTWTYTIDPKMGKLRADNIQHESCDQSAQLPPNIFAFSAEAFPLQTGQPQARTTGILAHVSEAGAFGFVKPDVGGDDILALPPCDGFMPVGSRVTYVVMRDPRDGKDCANYLEIEGGAGGYQKSPGGSFEGCVYPSLLSGHAAVLPQFGVPDPYNGLAPQPGVQSAALAQAATADLTGLIAQALPALAAQQAAGSDAGTLSAAASNIAETLAASVRNQVLTGLTGLAQGMTSPAQTQPSSEVALQAASNRTVLGSATGIMRHVQGSGKFGFIRPDCGSPDLLALSPQDGFPEVGTHVSFDIVTCERTGKLKADNVRPAHRGAHMIEPQVLGQEAYANGGYGPAWSSSAIENRSTPYGLGEALPPSEQGLVTPLYDVILTGSISSHKGKFGFIKQDSSQEFMFCLPAACDAFGRELPAVGTRVQYRVVMDPKTGRPRADSVAPTGM